MNIHSITVGPFEVNCFVIGTDDKRALVIDPGEDPERIELMLNETLRLSLAAILLTHGHADHIGALPRLARRYAAPVYMHPSDMMWAFSPSNQIPPFYKALPGTPDNLNSIEEGDVLEWPGVRFRVIETPGHTPGGVCFWDEKQNVLFSGDTLFKGSVGRTDLPRGDSRALAQSIKHLAALPPETRVYPGHGPDTTIGEEHQTNYFMAGQPAPDFP